MVTNTDGKVAVKYYQPTPKRVVIGNTVYDFVYRNYVSLAWINPEDVDKILSITNSSCNCSKGTSIFRLANERDVLIWENRLP